MNYHKKIAVLSTRMWHSNILNLSPFSVFNAFSCQIFVKELKSFAKIEAKVNQKYNYLASFSAAHLVISNFFDIKMVCRILSNNNINKATNQLRELDFSQPIRAADFATGFQP